jgi:hypothetical protein
LEWTDGRDRHARVLSMVTKLRNHGAAGPAPSTGAVSMPTRPATPLAVVTKRMLVALGLLAVSTLIVYLGRDGYVLSPEDPRAARLAAADRLILVSSREQPANGSAG